MSVWNRFIPEMRFIVIAMSNSKHLVQRVSTGGTHFVRYREAVLSSKSAFEKDEVVGEANELAILTARDLEIALDLLVTL